MNTLKVGILLIALTVLFVGIGSWLGGPSGAVVALLLALAMNGGSFWLSDRIILKMAGAQPLTPAEAPELHRMTERLAELRTLLSKNALSDCGSFPVCGMSIPRAASR